MKNRRLELRAFAKYLNKVFEQNFKERARQNRLSRTDWGGSYYDSGQQYHKEIPPGKKKDEK